VVFKALVGLDSVAYKVKDGQTKILMQRLWMNFLKKNTYLWM
jgi:hypothetical protein